MSDDAKADKVGTYTIRNGGRGPRYVNKPGGGQHQVPAGGEITVDLTAAEAKSAKSRGDLVVTGGKAKATPKAETGGDGGDGGNTDNDNPGGAAYVAHEGLGRWYVYDAADQKVVAAGEEKAKSMTKDEAKTWATENKVEFRGAD